jgi:hypothetical protein
LNVWKLCVARPAFWVSVWCMAFLVLSVFLRHLWWFVCTKMGSEVNDISFLRSSSEKSSASLSQYKKKKRCRFFGSRRKLESMPVPQIIEQIKADALQHGPREQRSFGVCPVGSRRLSCFYLISCWLLTTLLLFFSTPVVSVSLGLQLGRWLEP